MLLKSSVSLIFWLVLSIVESGVLKCTDYYCCTISLILSDFVLWRSIRYICIYHFYVFLMHWPFYIIKYYSVSVVKSPVLKPVLSVSSMDTLVLFWWLRVCIFESKLCLLQAVAGSWFFIHYGNLCLLIGVFNSFSFNAITDKGNKSLPLICSMCPIFLFHYFSITDLFFIE